ncbi:DUF4352 domain-containing protein [Heyndrickxia coagulans]|uniref:DUF4352 domain-containing protein n=1 Tax=Heyndrickxia coagulans TaxID=1398 RepID=UPI00069CBAB7|nr:DUF4352 domain-containing protein [Heyndrickxia coagulans]
MKKWHVLLVVLALVWGLAACGKSDKKAEAEGGSSNKNKLIEASITDASYALLKDDDADVSEDGEKDLLAVDLKIKNVSSDSVEISPYSNIKLYDGNEEVNIEDDIYSARLDMGTSRGGSIGAGNTKKDDRTGKSKKRQNIYIGHPAVYGKKRG